LRQNIPNAVLGQLLQIVSGGPALQDDPLLIQLHSQIANSPAGSRLNLSFQFALQFWKIIKHCYTNSILCYSNCSYPERSVLVSCIWATSVIMAALSRLDRFQASAALCNAPPYF